MTFSSSPLNTCVECEEIITNPICPECLTKRMKKVIGEYNKVLAEEIFASNIPGETRCLFCGKGMALCARCFSKDVYSFLEQKDTGAAQEFLSRFDFEIRKRQVEFY